MTTSTAPGKIILFGEHAVVYGRPALAVPVTQVGATATVAAADQPGIRIVAPDIGLDSWLEGLDPGHPLKRVIEAVLALPGMPACPPARIQITSTIPVAAGLGSGAAVSVAVIRALSGFLGQSLADEQVSALAFEIEKIHHGTPSGIDNTVITYAKAVFFIKEQPIELLEASAAFTLVIGDTGIPALTRESVGEVRRLWQADPTRWEDVFDQVGLIAQSARAHLVSGEWRGLGELMAANHRLLQELTVSSPELDSLVEAALACGALGAKMSGGGRGGNMIALVERENASMVAEALRNAGAKQTIITRVG